MRSLTQVHWNQIWRCSVPRSFGMGHPLQTRRSHRQPRHRLQTRHSHRKTRRRHLRLSLGCQRATRLHRQPRRMHLNYRQQRRQRLRRQPCRMHLRLLARIQRATCLSRCGLSSHSWTCFAACVDHMCMSAEPGAGANINRGGSATNAKSNSLSSAEASARGQSRASPRCR